MGQNIVLQIIWTGVTYFRAISCLKTPRASAYETGDYCFQHKRCGRSDLVRQSSGLARRDKLAVLRSWCVPREKLNWRIGRADSDNGRTTR
jgi:hypothetical protein